MGMYTVHECNIVSHSYVSFVVLRRTCYQPSALLELSLTTAIWSDEIRNQLTENIWSITMLTATPPTWCYTAMSPNEWTIIQNAIRGTINDDKTINASSGRSLANYPLAAAALGIEMPLKQHSGSSNSTSANSKYVLVTLLAIIAIVLMQCRLSLSSGNIPIVANRELAESASSNVPDSLTSCLGAQLLECTTSRISSDIHVPMNEKLETSNASMTYSEVFSVDEKLEEMMVPSISSLSDNVRDIITENVTTTTIDIPTDTVTLLNGLMHEHSSYPVMNVELAFDRNILKFVQLRAAKMEKGLRAFATSPAANHLRQLFKSLPQELAPMRKLLTVDIIVDPLTDIELAFQQEIMELVQFRTRKLDRRLHALATSPTTHRLQQIIASQANEGITILHSNLLKIVNMVQDSSLFKQAGTLLASIYFPIRTSVEQNLIILALTATHGNLMKVWFHNRAIQLRNGMASMAAHIQFIRDALA